MALLLFRKWQFEQLHLLSAFGLPAPPTNLTYPATRATHAHAPGISQSLASPGGMKAGARNLSSTQPAAAIVPATIGFVPLPLASVPTAVTAITRPKISNIRSQPITKLVEQREKHFSQSSRNILTA